MNHCDGTDLNQAHLTFTGSNYPPTESRRRKCLLLPVVRCSSPAPARDHDGSSGGRRREEGAAVRTVEEKGREAAVLAVTAVEGGEKGKTGGVDAGEAEVHGSWWRDRSCRRRNREREREREREVAVEARARTRTLAASFDDGGRGGARGRGGRRLRRRWDPEEETKEGDGGNYEEERKEAAIRPQRRRGRRRPCRQGRRSETGFWEMVSRVKSGDVGNDRRGEGDRDSGWRFLGCSWEAIGRGKNVFIGEEERRGTNGAAALLGRGRNREREVAEREKKKATNSGKTFG